jgi:ketol-acid reductoisomerase
LSQKERKKLKQIMVMLLDPKKKETYADRVKSSMKSNFSNDFMHGIDIGGRGRGGKWRGGSGMRG